MATPALDRARFLLALGLAGLTVLSLSGPAHSETSIESGPAPTCAPDAGWNDPATPLRIHGDTWYVGTCGISALLVTSPQGHVLIDGATPEAGSQILANIRTLGFDPRDVRAIVLSHEHFDHAGGLSELQQATGAPVLARAPAVGTLRRGASDRGDPQFLVLEGFEPVREVRVIADDEVVGVGALALQAIATPGHTAGGTSWTWRSCEGDVCHQVVYADSLAAISDDEYLYTDEAAHPGVVDRFRQTLARVAALDCDVLVTPHPSASRLWSRIGQGASEPLVDEGACRAYAARATVMLDQRLAHEAADPGDGHAP